MFDTIGYLWNHKSNKGDEKIICYAITAKALLFRKCKKCMDSRDLM
jgi:hypothetical protein